MSSGEVTPEPAQVGKRPGAGPHDQPDERAPDQAQHHGVSERAVALGVVTGAHGPCDNGLSAGTETGHRDPDEPRHVGTDADRIERRHHRRCRQMTREDRVHQPDAGGHGLLYQDRQRQDPDRRPQRSTGQLSRSDLTEGH